MEIVTTPAVHHNDSYYENEYVDWMELNGSGAGVDESWDEYYDWSKIISIISIISMVIYGVVCVLGVLGNGVVIWATGFRMKKTVNTVWYLNLAVADFLVTAFLPLDITQRALGHWPFGWFMCKMEGMVFYMNMYARIFTLVVISVDRCVGVVCPSWARCGGYRTVRKASWVSLGVWVLALALSSPHFIFKFTQPSGEKVRCSALVLDYSNHTLEEYQLIEFRVGVMVVTLFLLGFVVPFSVIVSCYSVLIYRLRSNRSLASQSGRSFKIIATVNAAFFLCWLPFHVFRLIYVGVSKFGVHIFGIPITRALVLLNSCLNPPVYVFSQGFKGVFRRNVLKVLEKAFAEEPPQANNTPPDPAINRPMIALSEDRG